MFVALRKNSKKGLKWNNEAYVKCNLHWITMIFLQQTGSTDVIYVHLDLASLKSVRSFAEAFLKTESRLDLLINNAGTHTTTQHHNVCLVASTRSIHPFSSTPTWEPDTIRRKFICWTSPLGDNDQVRVSIPDFPPENCGLRLAPLCVFITAVCWRLLPCEVHKTRSFV